MGSAQGNEQKLCQRPASSCFCLGTVKRGPRGQGLKAGGGDHSMVGGAPEPPAHQYQLQSGGPFQGVLGPAARGADGSPGRGASRSAAQVPCLSFSAFP